MSLPFLALDPTAGKLIVASGVALGATVIAFIRRGSLRPCEICGGLGSWKCVICDGSGAMFSGRVKTKCKACVGRGKRLCRECTGSGWAKGTNYIG